MKESQILFNISHMKCVIFDLDGTLLDTMEDIRHAVNYALSAFEGSPISGDECRRYVGRGLRNALVRAVAADRSIHLQSDEELDFMYSLLMGYYRNHPAVYARPYDGIPELLEDLQRRGIRMGVLSNKRDELVKAIVSDKFPSIRFSAVIGQADGIPLKPDRRAFDHALSAIGADIRDVLYIGDSEVDAETADNASAARIIVSYGFRSDEELRSRGIEPLPHVPSYDDIVRAYDGYWGRHDSQFN